MSISFDEHWLRDYLEKHPALAARMPQAAPRDPDEPEGVLMERLRTLAVEDLGYLYWHQYSAKRSTPGMVDSIMVRPADLLRPGEASTLYLVELKTATGIVSPAQRRWLEAFQRVTHVNAQVCRPQDYPALATLLIAGAGRSRMP
jgi:hypothetical protein